MSLTAEQLEFRKDKLGGTDAAIIAGVHPYTTKYALALEKTGQKPPPDLSDNEFVHFGTVLEGVVREEFARRSGLTVHRVNRTLTHPKHEWMIAHIDGRVVGEKAGFEAKTAGEFAGMRGFDDEKVPDHYFMQCMHYMAVTGWDVWHLGVLIGGNKFRSYVIPRDDILIARMIELEKEFIEMCRAGKLPDPATESDVLTAFPHTDGGEVVCEPALMSGVNRLRELKEAEKALKEEKTALEVEIKKAIGDASTLVASDGSVLATWKESKSTRFNSSAFKKENPDLFVEYAIESTSRRFLLK